MKKLITWIIWLVVCWFLLSIAAVRSGCGNGTDRNNDQQNNAQQNNIPYRILWEFDKSFSGYTFYNLILEFNGETIAPGTRVRVSITDPLTGEKFLNLNIDEYDVDKNRSTSGGSEVKVILSNLILYRGERLSGDVVGMLGGVDSFGETNVEKINLDWARVEFISPD